MQVMACWNRCGLYPDGQLLFYKGGDPGAFRQEVKERLELDPADGDRWELARQFWCPARMLDVVLTGERPHVGVSDSVISMSVHWSGQAERCSRA
jgi:hypothetical protein